MAHLTIPSARNLAISKALINGATAKDVGAEHQLTSSGVRQICFSTCWTLKHLANNAGRLKDYASVRTLSLKEVRDSAVFYNEEIALYESKNQYIEQAQATTRSIAS